VIAADEKFRISQKASGPGMHMLILDKTGDHTAIELRQRVHSPPFAVGLASELKIDCLSLR
jgi:hypothetical protein